MGWPRLDVLLIIVVIEVSPIRANATHLLTSDDQGNVALGTDEDILSASVCRMSSGRCVQMQEAGPGLFSAHAQDLGTSPRAYLVRYAARKKNGIWLFDEKSAVDTDQSGRYVVIGAIIGFLGTLLVEALRTVVTWFANRRLQVAQFRRNLFEICRDIVHGQDPTSQDIRTGLSCQGINQLARHIADAELVLTDVKLNKAAPPAAIAKLKAIQMRWLS